MQPVCVRVGWPTANRVAVPYWQCQTLRERNIAFLATAHPTIWHDFKTEVEWASWVEWASCPFLRFWRGQDAHSTPIQKKTDARLGLICTAHLRSRSVANGQSRFSPLPTLRLMCRINLYD
ncbi:MAG: hypothetical protein F6J98_47900 [Moorea sp. SIO4G2]|nr:hypothetical protein [Moorena sp. SIO4G2]